ncbi:M48 family metallopeptidase [Bacillus sp. ISL-57]|uniref:M48 family metallopeptidase n=1 Tax=Bacillus sp. ISL-57 TaxID=2819135 RepID=UPI001BE5C58A|nr:SprT family zinc-dependent metalloprotease [Bacillus sp. ISL-57]MBT2719201.1 M48 family metallopeptidase [Bacillus sp. ISL-57]
MHAIQFGNKTIPYTLSRSHRRKTLSISVNQHGVSVISPSDVDIEKIETTLHKKSVWIIKQLSDFNEMHTSVQERFFLSGEKLPYLGRQYRLKIIRTNTNEPSFRFYQGRFLAELPKETSEDEQRDVLYPLFVNWVKQRANKFAHDRLKRFTLKLQQEPKKIVIKDQEQRWGSCTPAGNILLNWRIFLAPTSIIDYVLAHELVHLKHMDHSKQYWETLRMLLPDYEQRKEWLRVQGGTLNV